MEVEAVEGFNVSQSFSIGRPALANTIDVFFVGGQFTHIPFPKIYRFLCVVEVDIFDCVKTESVNPKVKIKFCHVKDCLSYRRIVKIQFRHTAVKVAFIKLTCATGN